MATLVSWQSIYLSLIFLASGWCQKTNTYADRSYCVRCTAALDAEAAVSCGVEAILSNGCFAPLINDQCGAVGIVDARFNAATGRACASAGRCLTACGSIAATTIDMDWCCFKPGSIYIDDYIASLKPTPVASPLATPSSTPTPGPAKGVPCDIVDQMVANYQIAKMNGPLSLGYYGQMINIVCLRSTCSNVACGRVADQRAKTEECANLPASLPFEETVFRRIANEASDPAKIIDTANHAEAFGKKVEQALGYDILVNNIQPWKELVADRRSWGAVYAGFGHFMEHLAPYFSDYIKDLVNNNPDNEQLANAMEDLTQAQQGELDPKPAWLAGSVIIAIAAREFRNYYLYQWLKAAGKVTDPVDMSTKFGISLRPADNVIFDPGAFLGSLGRYVGIGWKRDDVQVLAQNATYRTSVSHIAITELSSSRGESIVSLEVPTTTFVLSVRDRENSLKPKLALTSLMYLLDRIPIAAVPLTVEGRLIQIIGPVAAVSPNENGISLINTTHVIPRNITSEPVPIGRYVDNLVARVSSQPLIPGTNDTGLLFRKATIKFSYNATYIQSLDLTIDAATDITIFDLVSGIPLQGVVHQSGITGGSFEATIEAGKGSWGRGYGGGGSFALGLLRNTTGSSSSVSHGIMPAVTTPAPNAGNIIWSGLGGVALATTMGHTSQHSSLNATRTGNSTVALSSPTSSMIPFTGAAARAGVPWVIHIVLLLVLGLGLDG